MLHQFKETTFNRPTYCDHCQGLLWGLVKQGLLCTGCRATCHSTCQDAMPACPEKKLVDNPSIYRKEETPATKSLRSLQQQLDPTPTKPKVTCPSSQELENIFVSAAIQADQTQVAQQYLSQMPALNPQTTAKNFSRFVSRCGPMFSFRDRLILLLSWDKPVESWMALIGYCFVCLYPVLILCLPQAVVCYLILSYRVQPRRETVTPIPTPAIVQHTVGQKQSHPSLLFPTSLFDEASPEYLKNMQNLQNMMGQLSDVYDLIASYQPWVDGSDQKTSLVFQLALLTGCLSVALVWWVPVRYVCCMAGIGLFMLNTRFMRFLVTELMPQLMAVAQDQWATVTEWYQEIEQALEAQEKQQEVSVYENQRWSGNAFGADLLPEERGPWSDLSGTLQLSAKQDMKPPKGYRWITEDWKLDTTGPWIDSLTGLEWIVVPEDEGWVYLDEHWQSKPPARMTRTRRWTRECEKE